MDVGLRKAPCALRLVCSLPIHTRNSANAERPRAHCQLKSYKMLYKYSTDYIWKGQQPANDLEGHSRSLPLLPFDKPYTISYWSSVVSIYLSCTGIEILTLVCQKLRRHMTLTTPTWGTVCHHKTNTSRPTRAQNWTILSSAIPEKCKGV